MDDFDLFLRNQVKSENWEVPKEFDETVNNVLNHLPKKKFYRRVSLKITAAVAAIAVLASTTAFAADLPAVKRSISNVTAYFDTNKTSRFSNDKNVIKKLNCMVGASAVDKGIKLTIDSVAVDNDFLDIFYTVESDEPINKSDDTFFSAYKDALIFNCLECYINGKFVKGDTNDLYSTEAYFESDYKVKGMKKLNLSLTDITDIHDSFNLTIHTDNIFDTEGNWNVSVSIRDNIKAAAKTFTPNQKAIINLGGKACSISIDKVILSPLGNQVVITEETPTSSSWVGTSFALLDDKGNVLDLSEYIKEKDMSENKDTYAYEFFKGDKDMKYITLVPLENSLDLGESITSDINKLPVNLKLSDYNGLVIDNAAFGQNQIKITYHKTGIYGAMDSNFDFFDKDGNRVELGNASVVDYVVDRQNGIHTVIFTSSDKSCDFSKIAKISAFQYKNFKPLYDEQIKIELSK